jgi:hypothetical protein
MRLLQILRHQDRHITATAGENVDTRWSSLMHAPHAQLKVIITALFAVLFSQGLDAAFTYTYTGNYFLNFANTQPEKKAYDLNKKVTFSFSTEQLIQNAELGAAMYNSWTFSDGTQTVNSTNVVGLGSFLLLIKASSNPEIVFDKWEIQLNYNIPFSTYPNYLNTTNRFNEFSQPLVYDWGQNEMGNYGGNNNSPGTWTVTAVPEPNSCILIFAGICFSFTMRRRSKS